MTRSSARGKPQGGDGGRASWYRISNLAGPTAEVWLYDEIGMWGITAGDFVRELQDIRAGEIELHINSPGGEVFDGMAIYNALRNHRAAVTVVIDGIAASAASFIAMAGDRVLIEPNGTMMIHDGQGICVGDSDDMRKLADLLDKCSDNIAGLYAERAGGTVADWRARMRDETWYNAKEAKAAGLVDDITKPSDRGTVRDDWDLSVFRYAGRRGAPPPVIEPVGVTNHATPPAVVADAGQGDVAPDAPDPDLEPPAAVFDVDTADTADTFRAAMARAAQVDFDPSTFRELMQSVAATAPQPPTPPPRTVDLGPPPPQTAPLEPEPEPNPWDTIRAAMAIAANDAPAPPQPHRPENPAEEPGFLFDASAFRAALRRATSE